MDQAERRGWRFRRAPASGPLAERAIAGIEPGDHVCVSFGSDDEQRSIVGRFASEAVARGDRLVYHTHLSDETTVRRYLDEAGVDATAGLALGQIQIKPIEHAVDTLDPERVIADLQAERRAALRDGYGALAHLAEMSWTLDRPADAELVLHYEREVNRVFAAADIAGICQYDRRLFPQELLERLIATHEFQVRTSAHDTTAARRRLTVTERDDGAVSIAGALDIDASAYLEARLAERAGPDDLVVWTSALGFADISGCRALVHAAERLEEGRRLTLPEPAAALVRVLCLCGWAHHPQLVLGDSIRR